MNLVPLAAGIGLMLLTTPVAAATVANSEFLVFLIGPDGETQVVHTDVVPLVPGQVCFGWRIRLADAEGVLKIVEELELPTAPAAWLGLDEYSPTQISPDGRTATTTSFIAATQELIENTWCLAPGDPAGPHSIRVSADGALLETFDFAVIEPEALSR